MDACSDITHHLSVNTRTRRANHGSIHQLAPILSPTVLREQQEQIQSITNEIKSTLQQTNALFQQLQDINPDVIMSKQVQSIAEQYKISLQRNLKYIKQNVLNSTISSRNSLVS